MRIREDLTGRVFNRWTVESEAVGTGDHRYWWCRCECGRRAIVYGGNVKAGKSRSCGHCVAAAETARRNTRHGYAAGPKPTVEYRTWQDIVKRCTNPRYRDYKNYGGRGITVCDRWRHTPAAFIEDMGLRPSYKHSIDRIDNNGPYSPENCRWATKKDQARNKRRTVWIEHNGQRKTAQAWAEELCIGPSVLTQRLQRGWSNADTIGMPILNGRTLFLTLDGITRSITEWAALTGIPRGTIRQRLRSGWSVKEALTGPRYRHRRSH